ncbi:hypothetical protein RHGRI_025978 [Rhododendron griersonianum]|uniref:Uncharacterized protein n=2 Tax=Rhododendron griersonianum TaxID=479676 RepID=A0AAV6IRY1_9ERIC|nr:hypothetical protein RHGRI_025978 [Rhododendron griersonianum]
MELMCGVRFWIGGVYNGRNQTSKSFGTAFPLQFWSLWKMRNEHLFQNKALNWKEAVYLIKLRIAFWVKSKGDYTDYSINDFLYKLRSIIQAS